MCCELTNLLGDGFVMMNSSAWRYYLRFYRASARPLAWCVTLAVAQSLLVLPVAFLLRRVFDKVIPAGNFRQLAAAGVGLLFLHLFSNGLSLWGKQQAIAITKTAIRALRDEILQRVYAFSRAYYTQADRSRLHATIVQDSDRVDSMSDALAAHFLPALATSIVLGLVLVYLNWFLFLVLAGCAPLLLLAHQRLKQRIMQQVADYHQSFKTFSRGTLFVLQMLDLTKLQTAEEFETERQRRQLEELSRVSAALRISQVAYSLTQHSLLALASIVILIIGGGSVAAGKMTLGELLSFYVVVGLFSTHLRQVAATVPQIIAGHDSLTRLFELMANDDTHPYAGRQRLAFQGQIKFDSVWFQYQDQAVLREINLTLSPGQTVVVVGPNGSGKTTLLNLLLGFYRPQQGQLYADDHPFSQLDLIHLRRSIAVVSQDPVIFPGTIRENLTYGCSEVSFQRIIAAAQLATANEFIEQLPQGYDAFVGDNGVLLSGGQRQRLAIARALLRQPKLLILDEPTNHLDAAAVEQLMHHLKTLDPIPAILIISHDPQIFQKVESVFALPEGRWMRSDEYQEKTSAAENQPPRRLLANTAP